jgi:hypothetical protein
MKKYYHQDLVGWLAAFLILFGYYLNANKHDECWPVWAVGNLLMGYYCHRKGAYPASAMSFVIVIMNVYGYATWA